MEQRNAAQALADTIAAAFGDSVWKTHRAPKPLVVGDLTLDQQADFFLNGYDISTHSGTGHIWPVYVRIKDTCGLLHRVLGYYTPEAMRRVTDDIARATGIRR